MAESPTRGQVTEALKTLGIEGPDLQSVWIGVSHGDEIRVHREPTDLPGVTQTSTIEIAED